MAVELERDSLKNELAAANEKLVENEKTEQVRSQFFLLGSIFIEHYTDNLRGDTLRFHFPKIFLRILLVVFPLALFTLSD